MQVVPGNHDAERDPVSSVSPKGQVTLPLEIRRLLGIQPKDKVAFRIQDGEVRVRPARSSLEAVYRSVPALKQPLSDKEMTEIAHEEHARQVVEEGNERRL